MIRYVNAYIIYTCIHYLDLSTLRRLSMNSESITSINIDMYRIHQGFFTYPTYRKCKKSIQFIQLYSSYSEGVIQYIYIQYVTYIHIHTYTHLLNAGLLTCWNGSGCENRADAEDPKKECWRDWVRVGGAVSFWATVLWCGEKPGGGTIMSLEDTDPSRDE